MAKARIFATPERERFLDENNIPYRIDLELNFCFYDEKTEEKAIQLLTEACEL